MTTVLVVDDMAAFREPIAASLRLAGYETLCAADGEDALEWTRRRRPDLILLDVAMPKMDGLTFLRHLRAEAGIAHTKVILLTALSEKKHVMAAATLGVRDYLLKSRFRLKDLEDRIKRLETPRAVSAGTDVRPSEPRPSEPSGRPRAIAETAAEATQTVPTPISRDKFLERIRHVCETKALSGAVAQVVLLASSSQGDMVQLADLIVRDPILSARVLQAANSASYASQGPAVTNIQSAIRKLGFNTIKNIAASISVFDCMPQGERDGFNPIRCWQHSFAVAQICERLAAVRSSDLSGLAYMVGLCHDLTDIFVRIEFGNEYQTLIELAKETGQSKDLLHCQVFGMTSAEMSSYVFSTLAIPEAIRRPIEGFLGAKTVSSSDPLVRILQMAEYYANAAQLASSPWSIVAPLTQSFCLAATGHPNPPRLDPQLLRAEVQGIAVTLSKLSRADEAKLLKSDFERRSSKVWFVRDPRMSDFDPLEVALGNLAETNMTHRLPFADEVPRIDGLVTIAANEGMPGFSQMETDAVCSLPCKSGKPLPLLSVANVDVKAIRKPHHRGGCGGISLASLAAFIKGL